MKKLITGSKTGREPSKNTRLLVLRSTLHHDYVHSQFYWQLLFMTFTIYLQQLELRFSAWEARRLLFFNNKLNQQ